MKKTFTISPRILLHLGEDLIKNESIALLELVKNSYDACAHNCTVSFISNDGHLETIVLEDDGFGMNKNIIENIWLKIGTDNKFKTIERNQCGRLPLGEKGIGRLGVHKLGNYVTLISKMADCNEVRVTIDWNKLYLSIEIEDFEVDVIESETPSVFKNGTGTKIIISELKTKWDRRSLREVYRNLNSLNSPFTKNSESFNLKIVSNDSLFDDLPDFEDIKNSALYFGHCKMSGNMITELDYEFKPWATLDKIDKGRQKHINEFSTNELVIIDEDRNQINLKQHNIGPIEFDLLIFEMDSQIFSYVNAEKKSIKDYLRENGGVRVYRDGVRVYNYGEKDNDWLGLDVKRLNRFGGNVSNQMIIGSVKIERACSKGLREKSNREGFIQDESYFAFLSAVDYAMSLIVRERNIDKHVLTTLYKKQKYIEPVLSDINELIIFVEDKVRDVVIKEEILKYLSRISSQYNEVKEVLIKSANAGLNLSVVIHEIEKLISQLSGFIERNESQKAISISLMLEKIIRGYSAMIKKSEIKETALSSIVKTALENYEFRFLDHKISIISNFENSKLTATLSEAESISILTNLLDNAIFWLSFARKDNRKISVYITDEIKIEGVEYSSIVISDNGPGFNIPPDMAIKPFMTGKPHNIGSGLGLHVANEMMKSMKGRLLFLNEHDLMLPNEAKDHNVDKAIIALCFPK